jgi:hypothetical protein
MFIIKLFLCRRIDALIALADEYVFHGDLEKIIEITYSYREIEGGYFLNGTLFEEYIKETYPNKNIDFLERKYKYKAQVQLIIIEDIIKKAKNISIDSRAESLRRCMFVEALEYVKTVLEVSIA